MIDSKANLAGLALRHVYGSCGGSRTNWVELKSCCQQSTKCNSITINVNVHKINIYISLFGNNSLVGHYSFTHLMTNHRL